MTSKEAKEPAASNAAQEAAPNSSEASSQADAANSAAAAPTEVPKIVPVHPHAATNALVDSAKYAEMYKQSIENPTAFWAEQAKKELVWDQPFHSVVQGSLEQGDVAWFANGKLNASVQCLDRHVWNPETADNTAIVWEGDEPGTGCKYTFRQALQEVCRIANALKSYGVRKGDAVTIYLPMTPEIVFAMLACARLGAPHCVVFAGFSSEALRDRIVDVHSRFIFTCDEGLRGGRTIPLKKTVDDALKDPRCDFVERVFVYKRTGNASVPFDASKGRDIWMQEEVVKHRPFCPAESMDSEDTLFYLYTSGSTGKPKGVAHTTAGYMLFAGMTQKYVFDVRPGDVYACVADAGWITGHTYIVYGPLANGSQTMIFESTPLYPDASRYWDLVERHKITQFYTAPTAIRALMRFGVDPVKKHDLSSLRVLGSVGEPIGPTPWNWYYEHVGSSRCAIVDTYWQTESGGIMLTPLPGANPMKPGSCCAPFFGIDPVVLDPSTGHEIPHVPGETSSGVLCIRKPWPGMTRTVRGDHERYMTTYFSAYKGYYFTGDGVIRDEEGYMWIQGRVDDVINTSGHRVGSGELEAIVNAHPSIAESAAIGFPHEIKGEGIAIYVTLKVGAVETPDLMSQLKQQVRNSLGAFSTPDWIIVTPGLPKTRSGKIMRRILRKVVSLETDSLGDISTLAEPAVVESLIEKVAQVMQDAKR